MRPAEPDRRGTIYLPERGFLYFRRIFETSPRISVSHAVKISFTHGPVHTSLTVDYPWRNFFVYRPQTHTQLLSRYKSINDDNWRSSLVTLGPGPLSLPASTDHFCGNITYDHILSVEDHDLQRGFHFGTFQHFRTAQQFHLDCIFLGEWILQQHRSHFPANLPTQH